MFKVIICGDEVIVDVSLHSISVRGGAYESSYAGSPSVEFYFILCRSETLTDWSSKIVGESCNLRV